MGEAHQRQAATLAVLVEGRKRAKAFDDAGNFVAGNAVEYDLRDLLVRAWFAEWLVPCTEADRLRALIRRAHDALSRGAWDLTPGERDELVADMAKELGL